MSMKTISVRRKILRSFLEVTLLFCAQAALADLELPSNVVSFDSSKKVSCESLLLRPIRVNSKVESFENARSVRGQRLAEHKLSASEFSDRVESLGHTIVDHMNALDKQSNHGAIRFVRESVDLMAQIQRLINDDFFWRRLNMNQKYQFEYMVEHFYQYLQNEEYAFVRKLADSNQIGAVSFLAEFTNDLDLFTVFLLDHEILAKNP